MSDLPDIIIKCDLHEWVECAERLPYPKNRRWLVYEDGNFHVAIYTGVKNCEWFNGCICVRPSHWMPLPFEPKILLPFKPKDESKECPDCGGEGYTTCCGVGCTEPGWPDSDICAGCYEHTGDKCETCEGKGEIKI